jgi:NADPH:quinone reductase-like Zn-dependent oxidoreductase
LRFFDSRSRLSLPPKAEWTATMKAAVIHEYGGPDVLKYEDYPDPALQSGEVLVRVAAAGVNPIDTLERAGQTKEWRPVQFPGVLGRDLSGTVEKLGPGAKGFSSGDRVLAWASHTYAELCAVNTELLARVPQGMDLVEAAALPLVTMTGSQLILVASGVKPGQTVLVSGAVGGVGRSAVFAAKDRGAVVIAAVLARQLDQAKLLGADQVVALDDPKAWQALPPVDVVANTVRGKTAEELLGKVKQGGTFASVTGAPANAARYPTVRMVAFASKQDTKNLEYMVEAASAAKFYIPIGSRPPLRNAAEAHAAVAKGGTGKILLLP